MKKLLTFFLFFPLCSFAQKIELSDMAGYSLVANGPFGSGFSNELELGYRFSKHFSISGLYETEWIGPTINAVGLSPDIMLNRFYFGADIKDVFINSSNPGNLHIKYDPSIGYGLHIGSKKRIYSHLYLVDQIGMSFFSFNANYTALDYYNTSSGYHESSINQMLRLLYFRIGLACRF